MGERRKFSLLRQLLEEVHKIEYPSVLCRVIVIHYEEKQLLQIASQLLDAQNEAGNSTLRSDSPVTALFAETFMHYAKGLINCIVSPILRAVAKLRSNNKQKLKSTAKQALKTLFASDYLFPATVRKVLGLVWSKTAVNGEGRLEIVGSVLFLRFLCPAIINPEKYFVYTPYPQSAKPFLVEVSKIIQNTVNGVEFEKPNYSKVNRMIVSYHPRVRKFLDELIHSQT